MKRILFALALIYLAGCKKNDVTVASTCNQQISYQNTVRPIFIAHCTAGGCHDGGDLPSLGDYLVAHDAAQQIRSAVISGVMPKNGTLSNSDKQSIICWIDAGAKNN